MKKFYIITVLAGLFSQQALAESNIHSTFILHKKHPAWFFGLYEIRKNPETSFKAVIEKWQKWTDKKWAVLASEICTTFAISELEFTSLLHNETALDLYSKIILPPEVSTKRSRVMAFIKHILRQHTKSKFKVTVCPEALHATENIGVSPKHLVVCDANFFSKKHIDYVYSKHSKGGIYYSPQTRRGDAACIDIKTFIMYALAVTASHINHDKDFFGKVIHCFTINSKQIPDDTKMNFEQFCHIRAAMEAIFQSINPLEVALFLQASVSPQSPYEQFEKTLWKKVVADLKKCYHPDDLEEYTKQMAPNLEQARARSPF